MKPSKKTSEDLVRHFQKRCKERLGFILTQKFLKEELRAGRLVLEEAESRTRKVFRLPRKHDSDYLVVYDKPRHAFVTVYKKGEKKCAFRGLVSETALR